jgi:hypothetical protein
VRNGKAIDPHGGYRMSYRKLSDQALAAATALG